MNTGAAGVSPVPGSEMPACLPSSYRVPTQKGPGNPGLFAMSVVEPQRYRYVPRNFCTSSAEYGLAAGSNVFQPDLA